MAKRLNAEKKAYVERIVNFMYKNHNSMWWSLDEMGQKWRREYQFNKKVLDEIVHESVLFMNLLDAELNYDFRKKMLNFISNYLCVYAARDPEMENDENRAYKQLNAFFDAWLKTSEQRKSESKKQRTQPHKNSKPSAPTERVTIADIRTCRTQRMAVAAAVVGAHVK